MSDYFRTQDETNEKRTQRNTFDLSFVLLYYKHRK